MRRPVWIYAVPALITGLLSAQALAAQAHVGNGKGTMTGMAKCPMMAAMTQGPDAVLSKRKTLALTAAQVDQLETLRAAETQAMKQPMDSMMALHKQLATLSEATQFDENAVRGVFDRMGAFHTAAGTAMLRAQHDARAVLTPKQREKLADGVGTMGTMNKSSMNKSSMNKSSMNKSGMNKSGMNKSGMNKSGMNKSGTAGKGMTHGDTAKPASSAGAGTAATSAPVPVPGKMVEVKMMGDAMGYRFEPANFTVKAGDKVRFTNVSGGPHNVVFWPDRIPPGTQAQLSGNMPNTTAPLTGPLLTAPNQTYVVSFAGLKPGTYRYYCTPHLALGMKGVITVR